MHQRPRTRAHVQVVLTRAAAVAERLWSPRRSPTDVARQRLAAFRCRLLRRGLQAAPVFPDACDAPVAPHPAHPFGGTAPPTNGTASQSRVPSRSPASTVVPSPDAVPPPPPHAASADSQAQGARFPPSSRASVLAGVAPLVPPAVLGAALLASLALNLLLCVGLWRRRQRPPRAAGAAERLKRD